MCCKYYIELGDRCEPRPIITDLFIIAFLFVAVCTHANKVVMLAMRVYVAI